MSPIEQVWDLVGLRLARDPCPALSEDELLLRIQAIWNSLPQADIQNLFDSMPRRIAALIAARFQEDVETCDSEDYGFQMLNDDEIVTSVQEESVSVDDEDINKESSKGPSNADAFSALETAMEW
ncbi:transposable element Tcb1 transposase [Trichonephila clavipes]|nr:transposable element Tcb1 transposase [Trichonephila clavipes]